MDECYYCEKPTDQYAADPGLWPLYYTHSDEPGKTKAHHVKCVQLMEKDAIRWQHVRENGFVFRDMSIWADIADNLVDSEIRRADSAGDSHGK